jgi:hypothetical protein
MAPIAHVGDRMKRHVAGALLHLHHDTVEGNSGQISIVIVAPDPKLGDLHGRKKSGDVVMG